MKPKLLCLLALLASLTGCVPADSLNPLYTSKDVIFDESLLGYWAGPPGEREGGVRFSAANDPGKKGYVVTVLTKQRGSEQEKMTFAGVLVKIGDHEFLDLVQTDWDTKTESISLQVNSEKNGISIQPRLTKLGASSYLEFNTATADDAGKIRATLRPAHWLVKVTRRQNKLLLEWPDDEEFTKAVLSGKLHLSSVTLDDGKNQSIVITADTLELQKFFSEHADDKVFFSGGIEDWLRKR